MPAGKSNEKWPQEAVRELARLWAEGYSASHIATVLSTPYRELTRNAVMGMKTRLGLKRDPNPEPSRSVAAVCFPKQSTPAATRASPVQPPCDTQPATPAQPRRRTLFDLADDDCRWSEVDDSEALSFSFPCKRKAVVGLPYCALHCSAAYYKPEQRLRAPRYYRSNNGG